MTEFDGLKTRTRAVLFSLGALSSYQGDEQLAALAFKTVLARFDLRGHATERYGLFCSRFSQATDWYRDQRFYHQSDLLRSAGLAGMRALGIQPSDADLEALQTACSEATLARMRAREEAIELLSHLRVFGVRTALVANVDCEHFRRLLGVSGLGEHVDVALCSEEAASCKPDPLVFYEALRRLGCRPSESLMVGTSPDLDVRGARLVGMRVALLAATGPCWWARPTDEPDHAISRLSEVKSLVTLPAPDAGPRVRRRAPQTVAAAG